MSATNGTRQHALDRERFLTRANSPMTSTSKATQDPNGAFQWDRGGWFGALFGGTCWLLITACLIAREDPLTAGVILICYAVSILYGFQLWRQRGDIRAYRAIQKLIVLEGLCALLAVATIDWRDAMQFLPESSRVPTWMLYSALLIFPALLTRFHFKEAGVRNQV